MNSVSPKGLQFLRSSKPDDQPTLRLPVTSEMSGDEEYRNKLSEFGEFNGLAPLKNEGLSEVRTSKLYRKWVDLFFCAFSTISSFLIFTLSCFHVL